MTKCETYAAELVAFKANRVPYLTDFQNKKTNAEGRLLAFQNSQGQYVCGNAVIKNLYLNVADTIENKLESAQCKGKPLPPLTGSLHPCSESGCENTILYDVNPALISMYAARVTYQQNEKNITDKESQLANDPECKKITLDESGQDLIDQARNRQIRNGVIWFLVVSSVIGVLIWLDKKYWHIVLK